MFRVTHEGEGLYDADTIEGAREIASGQSRGRYDVDEIRDELCTSGHTSRRRWHLIRHPDGRVEDEPHSWQSDCLPHA